MRAFTAAGTFAMILVASATTFATSSGRPIDPYDIVRAFSRSDALVKATLAPGPTDTVVTTTISEIARHRGSARQQVVYLGRAPNLDYTPDVEAWVVVETNRGHPNTVRGFFPLNSAAGQLIEAYVTYAHRNRNHVQVSFLLRDALVRALEDPSEDSGRLAFAILKHDPRFYVPFGQSFRGHSLVSAIIDGHSDLLNALVNAPEVSWELRFSFAIWLAQQGVLLKPELRISDLIEERVHDVLQLSSTGHSALPFAEYRNQTMGLDFEVGAGLSKLPEPIADSVVDRLSLLRGPALERVSSGLASYMHMTRLPEEVP